MSDEARDVLETLWAAFHAVRECGKVSQSAISLLESAAMQVQDCLADDGDDDDD